MLGYPAAVVGRLDDDSQTTEMPVLKGPVTQTPRLPTDGSARVVVLAGPYAGRRFALDGGATIGRSEPAEITVDDPLISRRHARIEAADDGFIVEDLSSRNGTFVNGAPIKRAPLRFGDRLRVGSTLLLLTHFDPIEEQLSQRQKFEAIGRLGTAIVHDLNNLIGAVLASAEHLDHTLDATPISVDECRESVQDIREATRRSAELVQRMLAFSRKGPKPSAPIDISAVVRDTVQLVHRAVPRSVKVESFVPGGLAVRGESTVLTSWSST